MTKSQFNIKISKDLLIKVKRQAMMSGKSLTEHITEMITNSLSDNGVHDTDLNYQNQIKDLEKRLLSLESVVGNREYISKKLKPFTNSEAINCTQFIRGVFYKQLEKRNFQNKSEAFDDFMNSIREVSELNESFSVRLKEIILSERPTPWTGKELIELTSNDKGNCPIRKALVNWTRVIKFPSQQEICDKGVELLALF